MFKTVLATCAFAAMTVAAFAPALAAGPGGPAKALGNAPVIRFLEAKRPTMAPFAHMRFCAKNPGDCEAGSGPDVIGLGDSQRKQLDNVNLSVNRSIKPINDGGPDEWQIDVTAGDCEDFALTKRHRLIALGWSPKALRMAVARTRDGEGHAVLVVKTDRGDLVLDNRTNEIKDWRQAGLYWVKIQSGDAPTTWYSL